MRAQQANGTESTHPTAATINHPPQLDAFRTSVMVTGLALANLGSPATVVANMLVLP
jgi:hypothetical protein